MRDDPDLPHDPSLFPVPYLSFSQVSKYLHCPEQYRLHYVVRLRPKAAPAPLVFGAKIHEAVAALLNLDDPLKVFLAAWEEVKHQDVAYRSRESWERLKDVGEKLLIRFLQKEAKRITKIVSVEESFRLRVTDLPLPFVGVVDFVGEVDGKNTVVDFKTASGAYNPHEVILSDQLTGYRMAHPGIESTALCVFVKTKEPTIAWHTAERNGTHLLEFVGKLRMVAEDLGRRRFFKRPGRWCTWCDYLPVCTGDRKTADETLIQIDST